MTSKLKTIHNETQRLTDENVKFDGRIEAMQMQIEEYFQNMKQLRKEYNKNLDKIFDLYDMFEREAEYNEPWMKARKKHKGNTRKNNLKTT